MTLLERLQLGRTDGKTDGKTDGRKDGRTPGISISPDRVAAGDKNDMDSSREGSGNPKIIIQMLPNGLQ